VFSVLIKPSLCGSFNNTGFGADPRIVFNKQLSGTRLEFAQKKFPAGRVYVGRFPRGGASVRMSLIRHKWTG
jgi:hypothetical protein